MEKLQLELTPECAAAIRHLASGLTISESFMIEGLFMKHLAEKNAEIEINGPQPMIYPEYSKANGEEIRGKALYEMLLKMEKDKLRKVEG